MGENVTTGIQGRDISVGGCLINVVNGGSSSSQVVLLTRSFWMNVTAPIKTFKGREKLIQKIHEKLAERSRERNWSDRILALVGFGGMGKTELVRKFLEVHEEAYPNVAWINAESEATIMNSFGKLAEILKLPVSNTENGKEIAEKVFSHVGEHVPSSLFVFDNSTRLHTDDSSFGIFEYLPKQRYTHKPLCLVTSRTTEWRADNIRTLPVEELTRDESIGFLIGRFELSETNLGKENIERQNLSSALEELYGCVQGYPLALQLAAANVKYRPNDEPIALLQKRLENFITKLKKLQASVMMERVNRGGTDYEGNFQIIWDMTMERISADEYALPAMHLLQILAYMEPDGTLCEEVKVAFEVYLTDESKTSEEKLFEEALSVLKKLVLVRTYKDIKGKLYTQMHRLVQSFARRDDSEGNGMCCIAHLVPLNLTTCFIRSQQRLAMPPAVLRSDRRVASWLYTFLLVSVCYAGWEHPNLATYLEGFLPAPELVFDGTHVEQLKRRRSACLPEILATVEFIRRRKVQPVSFVSSLTDLVMRLTMNPGSQFAFFMYENFIQSVGFFLSPYWIGPTQLHESSKLIRAIEAILPEGLVLFIQQWFLLLYQVRKDIGVIRGPPTGAIAVDAEKKASYERFYFIFSTFFDMLTYVPDFRILLHATWGFFWLFRLDRFQSFVHLRKYDVNKLQFTILSQTTFNLEFKKRLQCAQNKCTAELELKYNRQDEIGGSGPRSTSETSGQGIISNARAGNDKPICDYGVLWEVYMGYMVAYAFALRDYDLNGDDFSEILGKWLPSADYLSRLPAYLEFLISDENNWQGGKSAKFATWNTEKDRVILNRVLTELYQNAGPASAVHTEVIQSLQNFNSKLVKGEDSEINPLKLSCRAKFSQFAGLLVFSLFIFLTRPHFRTFPAILKICLKSVLFLVGFAIVSLEAYHLIVEILQFQLHGYDDADTVELVRNGVCRVPRFQNII